jgi:hypothetical protein
MMRALLICSAISAAAASSFAAEAPADLVAAAKEASDKQPWRVEARISTDADNFKISGIVHDRDFDLTVENAAGVKRQIVIGERGWMSEDGGRTWSEGKADDRRFYYLAHTPIRFPGREKIPPFELVGKVQEGNDSLLHVRFKAPEKVGFEGDRPNTWILLRDDKPVSVRRYHGPAAFENTYVTSRVEYSPVADAQPVMPPPGNPTAAAAAPGPEGLLMAAMKKMSSGTWEVKGTATFKKTIKITGLLSGRDFDLSMEPGSKPGSPLRGIMIGDKAWVCSDGKTWRTGSKDDRMLYNLTHTPISSGRMEPAFEEVGREQRDGATWLHIRLKVPEKVDPKSLPQYWLVLDADGTPRYIGHVEMPTVTRGSSDVTLCSFDYAPAAREITPPTGSKAKQQALGAPIDDEIHGFQDIEANKLKWAGKVVRVSLSPKLLQSEEIGRGVYRAMLKDTATPRPSYGLVEFPKGGLIELGFLKKTVSGARNWSELEEMGALGRTEGEPVSLYVQVVPIGQKPAARCIAVGSKMARGSDGAVTYSW